VPKILYIAAVLALTLLTLAEAIPKLRGVLPLGGSQITQLGIVLGSVFAVYEITEFWNEFWPLVQ
jgi:hypothetical protein